MAGAILWRSRTIKYTTHHVSRHAVEDIEWTKSPRPSSEKEVTVDDLIALATANDVTVETIRLPDDYLGVYLPDQKRIYLDSRLTPVEERCVLAHELGHVFFGHPAIGPYTPGSAMRDERQADRYAARLLIDDDDYARLEAFSDDRYALAEALDVTVDIIDVYRSQLDRSRRVEAWRAPRADHDLMLHEPEGPLR
jgi:Zn-dependent peptidase ImmA (M78 family)